jgi:hypothetical protein
MNFNTLFYLFTPTLYAAIFVIIYSFTRHFGEYVFLEKNQSVWLYHFYTFGICGIACFVLYGESPDIYTPIKLARIFIMIYLPAFSGMFLAGLKKGDRENNKSSN